MNIAVLSRAFCTAVRTMPKSHYAVRSGRKKGVYQTWDECKAQVNGFQGARFKKFPTAKEAWDFVNDREGTKPSSSKGKNSSASASSSKKAAAAAKSYEPASIGPDHAPTTSTSASVSDESTCKGNSSKRKYESDMDPGAFSYPNTKKRYYSTSTALLSTLSSSDIIISLKDPVAERAVVYTDGSCGNNGRMGAKAGVGVYWGDNSPCNTSERLEGRQTNQRAEITAAIRALETAKSRRMNEVTLYTDSKYTINAITDWIHRWKQNGWKTMDNKEVQNKEDLQILDQLCQHVDVEWKYVPGHANIKGNEAADTLAKAGARMPSLS